MGGRGKLIGPLPGVFGKGGGRMAPAFVFCLLALLQPALAAARAHLCASGPAKAGGRQLLLAANGTAPHAEGKQLAIVTQVTKEVEAYGAFSAAINAHWASSHGHSFLVFSEPVDPPLWDPRFAKVLLLRDQLRRWLEHDGPDWVLWIDADAVLVQHPARGERRLGEASGGAGALDAVLRLAAGAGAEVEMLVGRAHRRIAAGWSHLANTGTLLIRGRSRWAVDFMEHWWSEGAHWRETDQDTLQRLYSQNYSGALSRIQLLPPSALNSNDFFVAAPPSQQPVVHLSGLPLVVRKAFFRGAWAQLCQGRAAAWEFLPAGGVLLPLRTLFLDALQECGQGARHALPHPAAEAPLQRSCLAELAWQHSLNDEHALAAETFREVFRLHEAHSSQRRILLGTIGDELFLAGRQAEAEAHFTRALESTHEVQPHQLAALKASSARSMLLDPSRHSEAEAVLNEALQVMGWADDGACGGGIPRFELLDIFQALADAHAASGRLGEAVRFAEHAVCGNLRRVGEADLDTLQAIISLADLLIRGGSGGAPLGDGARAALATAGLLPASAPGEAALAAQPLAEAGALIEAVLATDAAMRVALGTAASAPPAWQARRAQALLVKAELAAATGGGPGEAVALGMESLSIYEAFVAAHGARRERLTLARMRRDLAAMLMKSEDLPGARRLLDKSLEAFAAEGQGPGHVDHAVSLFHLAELLRRSPGAPQAAGAAGAGGAARRAEATALFRQASAVLLEGGGGAHRDLAATALAQVGKDQVEQAVHERQAGASGSAGALAASAMGSLRQALQLRREVFGGRSAEVVDSWNLIAASQARLERFEEAEASYKRGLSIGGKASSRQQAASRELTTVMLSNLGALLRQRGAVTEAASALKRGAEALKKVPSSRSRGRDLLTMLQSLAVVELEAARPLKAFAAAGELLLHGSEQDEALSEATLRLLGDVAYRATEEDRGRASEASSMLREALRLHSKAHGARGKRRKKRRTARTQAAAELLESLSGVLQLSGDHGPAAEALEESMAIRKALADGSAAPRTEVRSVHSEL